MNIVPLDIFVKGAIDCIDIVPICYKLPGGKVLIETISKDPFRPYMVTDKNMSKTIFVLSERHEIYMPLYTNLIPAINNIPKKIMQTWKTKMIEGTDIAFPTSVLKKMNPEYEHTLLDDNDCIEYIKLHYGERELNAYNSIKPGAYKADLFRYLYLYKEGGYYVDIKSSPLKGFDFICTSNTELLLIKDRHEYGIYNGLIGCIPEHPLMKIAYEESIRRIEERFYGENNLDITGPSLFRWAYNTWMNVDINKKIDINNTHNNTIIWLEYSALDYARIIDRRGIKVFNRIFSTYYTNYNKPITYYGDIWDNRDVYYEKSPNKILSS